MEKYCIKKEVKTKSSWDDTIAKLNTQFGKGTVQSMSEGNNQQVEVISTGNLAIDKALGVGGIPKGRVVEVYGNESSGKTTLCLHIVAEAQKGGGKVAYIDAEHSLDPLYAKAIGVDVDKMWICQPDNGEQGLTVANELVKTGEAAVIVVDSVAALTPKAELDGEIGDSHMGLQARMMSQALRMMTAITQKSKTIVLFINQTRANIGGYGASVVTTGGNALKFYASIRIKVAKGEKVGKTGEETANVMRVEIVKNKVAPPFRRAECEIIFGEGISNEATLRDLAVEQGILQKGGSWYKYKGQNIANGGEAMRRWLKDNPKEREEIEKAVRAKL